MSTQLDPKAVAPPRPIPRCPQLAERADREPGGAAEDPPPPPPTNTGTRGRRPQPIAQPGRQPSRR